MNKQESWSTFPTGPSTGSSPQIKRFCFIPCVYSLSLLSHWGNYDLGWSNFFPSATFMFKNNQVSQFNWFSNC